MSTDPSLSIRTTGDFSDITLGNSSDILEKDDGSQRPARFALPGGGNNNMTVTKPTAKSRHLGDSKNLPGGGAARPNDAISYKKFATLREKAAVKAGVKSGAKWSIGSLLVGAGGVAVGLKLAGVGVAAVIGGPWTLGAVALFLVGVAVVSAWRGHKAAAQERKVWDECAEKSLENIAAGQVARQLERIENQLGNRSRKVESKIDNVGKQVEDVHQQLQNRPSAAHDKELAELKGQIAGFRDSIEGMKKTIGTHWNDADSPLQDDVKKLQEAVDAMQAKLDTSMTHLQEGKIAQLEKELKEMRKQRDAAQAKHKELTAQLTGAKDTFDAMSPSIPPNSRNNKLVNDILAKRAERKSRLEEWRSSRSNASRSTGPTPKPGSGGHHVKVGSSSKHQSVASVRQQNQADATATTGNQLNHENTLKSSGRKPMPRSKSQTTKERKANDRVTKEQRNKLRSEKSQKKGSKSRLAAAPQAKPNAKSNQKSAGLASPQSKANDEATTQNRNNQDSGPRMPKK